MGSLKPTFKKLLVKGTNSAKEFFKDEIAFVKSSFDSMTEGLHRPIEVNTAFGIYSLVEPGNVSELKTCPTYIPHPPYCSGVNETIPNEIEIKNPHQISSMIHSCVLARKVLNAAENYVRIGITTDELDSYIHNLIISNGAYPSPLRFDEFPKSICTSVNNVVVHGIPDDRKLENGDIISVDVSVYFNGYHGDCAKTFLIGDVDSEGRKLVEDAKEILGAGIRSCGPGKPFEIIGSTIEQEATRRKRTVIPCVTGHGIGQYFHGLPSIQHNEDYYADNEDVMQPGMTFTIEPAIGQGTCEVELHDDGWTVSTVDGSRTAQFEHTVLITDSGVEILTR